MANEQPAVPDWSFEDMVKKALDALARPGSRLEKRLQGAPWSVASGGLVCFVLLSVFSCMGPQPAKDTVDNMQTAREISGEPWIRVLLVENQPTATLAVDGLCAVHTVDPKTGRATAHAPVATLDTLKQTTIRSDRQAIIIEGQARYSGAIVLRPRKRDALKINGKKYRGELVIKSGEKGLRLINELPLEEYLCGVIGREMPLGFPTQALVSQAIAARTYALWQIKKKQKLDHDVKNDTRSQVYGGLGAEHPTARKIINQTRGLVATYKGQIFQTFFHSTCGGQTIPASWIFGKDQPFPLDQGATCGRCVSSKYHRWQSTLTVPELVKRLRARGFSVVEPVKSVKTVSWNRGLYQKAVKISHGGGVLSVPAYKFRSVAGLRSPAFALNVQGEQLNFKGEGWGHGVGLCQVGAKGFAKEGLTGVEIITHYYPSSTVEKIY